MLEHGGRLLSAARQFGIAPADWLDLSAALNPEPYPVPPVPPSIWLRLPEEEDDLLVSAAAYYGTTHFLPLPGSQAAIQWLPVLLKEQLFKEQLRVGYVVPTYNEHPHAWQKAGHTLVPLTAKDIDHHTDALDVLVLVNPNNPTGEMYSSIALKRWHAALSGRGGCLIVDEAFIDASPEHSLLSMAGIKGLVILRSLGKFFGLAGARVGFLFGENSLLEQMRECLGPWSICHPSRYVASAALADTVWQSQQRHRLLHKSARLCALLSSLGFHPSGGTALFQWVQTDQANLIYNTLAAQGILVRYYEETSSVRFGLPASESDWQRLECTLMVLAKPILRSSIYG
jgi:cobalamin biosynthetic protein CobC